MKNKIEYIKIYVERNCGTNYLSRLITQNFEIEQLVGGYKLWTKKLLRILPKSEKIKDNYFKKTVHKNFGWKHREIENLELYNKNYMTDKTLFISISKNPYSFLLSLYKRPYHYQNSNESNFNFFLTKKWKTLERESSRDFYSNPIDMWNKKNLSYFKLNNFNHLHIKYEMLLINPESVFKQISKIIGLPFKNQYFLNYYLSAKSDKDKDYNFYRNYYGNDLWKDKLSSCSIKLINEELNYDLSNKLEYKLL